MFMGICNLHLSQLELPFSPRFFPILLSLHSFSLPPSLTRFVFFISEVSEKTYRRSGITFNGGFQITLWSSLCYSHSIAMFGDLGGIRIWWPHFRISWRVIFTRLWINPFGSSRHDESNEPHIRYAPSSRSPFPSALRNAADSFLYMPHSDRRRRDAEIALERPIFRGISKQLSPVAGPRPKYCQPGNLCAQLGWVSDVRCCALTAPPPFRPQPCFPPFLFLCPFPLFPPFLFSFPLSSLWERVCIDYSSIASSSLHSTHSLAAFSSSQSSTHWLVRHPQPPN